MSAGVAAVAPPASAGQRPMQKRSRAALEDREKFLDDFLIGNLVQGELISTRDNVRRAQLNASVPRTVAPDPVVPVIETARAAQVEADSVWVGARPPSFDKYCVDIDGCPLFPRQYDVFKACGLLEPEAVIAKQRLLHQIILVFGKGCLASESLLHDLSSGETRTVAEWARDGRPLRLMTFDEATGRTFAAWTSPVYKKGRAPILRVTLDDGRVFRATAKHRCLTPDGWRHLEELAPSSQVQSIPLHGNYGDLSTIVSIESQGEEDFYDLTVPGTHCYFDAQGILHHNSGKDYMIAKFLSWVFLVLCNLREDPARYFGLAPYSRLSIINVASTAVQAKNVFFTQYLKRFISHKIFTAMKLVASDERRAKADEGKMSADSIIYKRTNVDGTHYECIGIYSMHSKATSLEGHNVFASVMDEADAMLDTEDRSNAEEVYSVLQSSSQRFQNNYLMAIISYPRIKDGFMMRMRATALEEMKINGDKASMYTDIAPTWVVNPKFDRDNPDIVRQFRDNFAIANAMYGCEPMEGESAFFDFPEMIDKSVEPGRAPICTVTTEPLNLAMNNGGEAYYVKGVIGPIRRTPGYSYYMAADAGAKKDAYALSIWHIDMAPAAYGWLCPEHGRDASMRQAADYIKLPMGSRIAYDPAVCCGVCLRQPHEFSGGWQGGTVGMQDWWQKLGRDESTLLDSEGRAFNIGHMYEDLIIQIKPQRATNSDKTSESGKNRMVYFPGIQDMCAKLITSLDVACARFDPHQTIEVTQGLIASTGGDIGELSQSNPEQLRRASFVKAMLHSGLLTFLPHEERDREWKRLQLVRGLKIDHPTGGSKDIYDAESMCIWTAASHRCDRLTVDWV